MRSTRVCTCLCFLLSLGCSGASKSAENPAPKDTLLTLVSDRFPAADATAVCADVPLRLSFKDAVGVGTAGKIQVFNAAQPDTPVATIDLAAATFSDTIATQYFFQNRPVFIDGKDAVMYLPWHALTPNTSYFVSIDAGVFTDASQAALGGVTSPSAWRFTTTAPAPASASDLTVARDGSGDFCTVQGAVDFVPAANLDPVRISIKNGLYHEIVFIKGKSNLTLQGEDRKNTVLAYANNDALQHIRGGAYRAMVEVEASNGLVIENMTLHNTSGQCQTGCQAEAIRVNASSNVIFRNADFISLQDTLYLNGKVYVADSYVEGNVDFIWGAGTAYFDRCEIKTVGRPGYNVQARNAAASYGYVFVDSKITADPNIVGHMLARTDPKYGTPHVAYINCQLGPHISPKGWLVQPATPMSADLRFWEYQSTDLDGLPVDVSARDPASTQISDEQAAMMRDKATVLSGWDPTAQ